ncbi:Phosphatidylinositol 4-phosphate 3-kinase C2 domain-containing subunit beta [Armadillidium vulgare]|nr:Phosphatidylinositol 4-phosphate 3-kinase C2 domain-containing subunit beta [Armadillidium vulgare]
MGDETPPPLPPKMRSRYSEEDQAKALEEEKLAFERIHKEKLERSHSQNYKYSLYCQCLLISFFFTAQRSHTPTDNRSHLYDGNYISKTIVRPIAKPRSISLIKDNEIKNGQTISDRNSNFQKEENKNDDLMSFVSPEKPNNELNDKIKKLQDLNKNSKLFRPVTVTSNQFNSFQKPSLSSSHSMPLGMNAMFNSPTIAPNMSLWNPGNLTNGSFSSYSQNASYLSNLKLQYPQKSSYSFTSNIPLGPEQSITPPPLPNRSPVVDVNRLSYGMIPGPISISSTLPTISCSVSSSNMQSSNTSSQTFTVKTTKAITNTCSSLSPATSTITFPAKTEKPLIPKLTKEPSRDLIDFGSKDSPRHSNKEILFSSVLEAFDPLKAKLEPEHAVPLPFDSNSDVPISEEARELLKLKSSRKIKDDEQSYYEQVDPFQYMHPSAASTRSDPVLDIYDGLISPGAVGGETFDVPPPLPPKTSQKEESSQKVSIKEKKSSNEKESLPIDNEKVTKGLIRIKKTESLNADKQAQAFWNRIKKLRSEYAYHDHIGNPGLLHSPCLETTYLSNLSVKLAVYYISLDPVLFTCNLSTSVEHVVMQSMVALELSGDCCDYLLKVRGIDEYLCGDTQLGEYDYVHLCIKYDSDILFTLLNFDEAKKSYMRTVNILQAEDDVSVERAEAKDLLTVGSMDAVYYDSLAIAVETFESELSKLQLSGFKLLEGTPNHELGSPMRSKHLRQVVKQICALLGELETVGISKAVECLIGTCRIIQKSQGVLDGEDDIPGQTGFLSTGSHDSAQPAEELKMKLIEALNYLGLELNNFLHMYMGAFRVDFIIDKNGDGNDEVLDLSTVRDRIEVQVSGLHRLDNEWHFDEFFIECQIFHGSSCVGKPHYTTLKGMDSDSKFYPKVTFDEKVDIEARFNTLPRESRMVFTVFGVKKLVSENKDSNNESRYIREELSWAAIQMFSFDGCLATGGFLLPLWPMASDKRLGPAPCSSDHPFAHSSVNLREFGAKVYFPTIEPSPPNKLKFEDLDLNTQQQLQDIIERDIFTFNKSSIEEREILWEKRHYLHDKPDAFAKVLLAAHAWDIACLPDLHSLTLNWTSIPPADALHLLLPSFPDTVVRNKAVEWIRGLGSDELTAYLPQLVQAVKHEAFDVSKLTELLLERALTSPRLAHHLYWLLNQCLPLQTSMGGEREVLADARYTRRLNMVTRALMKICGKNLENRLLRQEAVLRVSFHFTLIN